MFRKGRRGGEGMRHKHRNHNTIHLVATRVGEDLGNHQPTHVRSYRVCRAIDLRITVDALQRAQYPPKQRKTGKTFPHHSTQKKIHNSHDTVLCRKRLTSSLKTGHAANVATPMPGAEDKEVHVRPTLEPFRSVYAPLLQSPTAHSNNNVSRVRASGRRGQ